RQSKRARIRHTAPALGCAADPRLIMSGDPKSRRRTVTTTSYSPEAAERGFAPDRDEGLHPLSPSDYPRQSIGAGTEPAGLRPPRKSIPSLVLPVFPPRGRKSSSLRSRARRRQTPLSEAPR